MGEASLESLHAVAGVRLGTVCAGIKTPDRKDLVLIELAAGSHCVGVFTRNAFCAAPVTVAKNHLKACGQEPGYLLVNTGNANAGTGEKGIAAALACTQAVGAATAADETAVLPFSTGVIGEALPVERIVNAIPGALEALSTEGWLDAAEGILTTDTRPKGKSVRFDCEGHSYTVTGIAKGAGMIRPNMATMLSYIATDAAVEKPMLQKLLSESVDLSFNRITVDGDTSTNDACMLIASGQAHNTPISDENSPLYVALREALEQVCISLAQGLVRDGEGASKFVTVQIDGGSSEAECLEVAYTIAHSPLVKTALFASDPNWGRLLMAIGRADIAELDVERVSVYLNEVLIAEGGCRAESYTEEQGVTAMTPDDIIIRVALDRGGASATVWTTDFSYDYVRINAEYRT